MPMRVLGRIVCGSQKMEITFISNWRVPIVKFVIPDVTPKAVIKQLILCKITGSVIEEFAQSTQLIPLHLLEPAIYPSLSEC